MKPDGSWHLIWGSVSRLLASSIFVACTMMGTVVITLTSCGDPYLNRDNNKNLGLLYLRHFETFPETQMIPEAQTEVERLFPPGSKSSDFEIYFKSPEINCSHGEDYFGSYIACIYERSGLWFVSTDWVVVGRLDPSLSHLTKVVVNRYLTGL